MNEPTNISSKHIWIGGLVEPLEELNDATYWIQPFFEVNLTVIGVIFEWGHCPETD